MAPSILSSIRCSRHVPFAENHLQILIFPPPCFTVGMVFSGLYSSFVLQTRQVEFIPKVIFWSHLTTLPSPMPPLDHPDGLWQTSDGPRHVLSLSRSCWCAQAGHQMSLCVEHMACCLFGAMCSHVDCLSPPILLLNHCFSGSSCVSLVTLVCLPI